MDGIILMPVMQKSNGESDIRHICCASERLPALAGVCRGKTKGLISPESGD